MTHDYKRHGTTTLFAALNVLDGTVIGINAYFTEHNVSPKPFVWTQSAQAILAELDRCPAASV